MHNDPDGALSVLVDCYHEVARDSAAMVVVGSDHTDVGSPTEFSYNARIAVNLDAPVLLVVPGRRRGPGEIRTSADLAVAELAAQYGRLLGIVANRVDPDVLGTVRAA